MLLAGGIVPPVISNVPPNTRINKNSETPMGAYFAAKSGHLGALGAMVPGEFRVL